MTITSEERELLDMLHKATPEGKRLMVIELIALNRLDGQAGREIPKCSRAEYKRHIKALRQVQHKRHSSNQADSHQKHRPYPRGLPHQVTRKARALRKGRFSYLWDCKNGHNLGIIALKTTKNY